MSNEWTAKQIQPPYIIHYGISAASPDAVVRQLKEAGVNIVSSNNWFDCSVQTKTNISQICQKYHMGLTPWGMFTPSYRAELIPLWSEDPAIFGWYLWDEPPREGAWGMGQPAYYHLMQELYGQFKNWSGGLPMLGIWDDPEWGKNIGPGIIDILGYEVAYPFGNFSDPYAFTTNRTKIYGFGGGPLYKAKQIGVMVIPVLQAWEIRGHQYPGMPDPPGQYDAYQAGFMGGEFADAAYLYDPSGHVIGIPELKALIQQLNQKLGGTIWLPEEEITCPQCESLLKIHT